VTDRHQTRSSEGEDAVTTARSTQNDRTIPGAAARSNALLSIPEVIAEIGVPRSTFYRWRQLGVGPKAIKLPNGQVRVRRSALDDWLSSLEGDVA
jgi:predicted DNA-binding transcriptional regulator AlpA